MVYAASSLALELCRYEPQRHAVVAIAQAGRLGTVVEYVAMMAAAFRAVILGARKHELHIGLRREHAGDRREIARPARTAIELHRRREERQRAACADESAGPM